MSEHTSNTTSGPDGEEWERAIGAARTLLSSDCGWLELFTRAILEEKGVPYGKGLPNPEAPHIPEDKEIEEETIPGQGEPTPTAPVMPAGTRRNPSDRGFRPMPGKPATATRNRRKTQRTVTTPLQRTMRRNPTPVYRPRRRGRRISAGTNPATSIPRGPGTCQASSERECGAARPTTRTSPRSWKGS